VQKFGKNGIASQLLELGEVADCIFFFNGAAPRNETCFKEHTFRQRGFTGAGMTQ